VGITGTGLGDPAYFCHGGALVEEAPELIPESVLLFRESKIHHRLLSSRRR
jgi:hypothetical protein